MSIDEEEKPIDVAYISEDYRVECYLCKYEGKFDSMEHLEFHLQQHFKLTHGFPVIQRASEATGKVTRIPE